MRLAFWQGLQEYAKHDGNVRLTRRPAPGHCYDVARFGKAGFVLQAIALRRPTNDVLGPHELRLQLKIEAEADRSFRKLKAQRGDIHDELGFKLKWHRPGAELRRRAYVVYNDGPVDLEDKASHSILYDWLLQRTERIRTVFRSRVGEL